MSTETAPISKSEAAAMAIRVADASRILASLLDGAADTTRPGDYKRITLLNIARERNRHLAHVAERLREQSLTSEAKS